MIRMFGLLGLLALALVVPASAQAPVARAPLDLFVGYDSFRSPDLSPDGRYVAVIHREAIGDVLTVVDLDTHHVSRVSVARADQQMQLDFVIFKSNDRLVFGLTQKVHVVAARTTIHRVEHTDDAFEYDSRVYSSALDGSDLRALYDPSADQGFERYYSASIVSTLDNDPNDVLLLTPAYGGPELWRVNVRTGAHSVVEHGGATTGGWVTDNEGTPVIRIDSVANGRGYAYLRRGPGQRGWTEIVRYIGADGANSGPTFQPVGAATHPGQVFVLARKDGDDTSGLYLYDTTNGQYLETIGSNPNFDVTDTAFDARTGTILAACWEAQRYTCEPKDDNFARNWRSITHALGDNVNVRYYGRGREDNSRWLIHTNGPQDLGSYYVYDSNAHTLNVLFGNRPEVSTALLPTERVVNYTTSDGQQQWGYLWIPPGVTNAANLPTIVMPHGGPESRDEWGDSLALGFASQGYAVFQPNFRGGGGFGRRFVQAGWRQWGQRMQDDVSDGVHALVQQGLIDANRICIWGWSYGGYVALTASFENTDIYKCSVAGAGISDMAAMLRWTRDGQSGHDVAPTGGGGSQSTTYKYWSDAMGDLNADRAMLDAHSAAHNAERVTIPLLLIHGDEDWTVPYEQSQIMQRAMERAGRPVRLVTLQGMNHYYLPDQAEGWRTVFTESLGFIGQNIGPGVTPGSQ